jgi:hypothetical protein
MRHFLLTVVLLSLIAPLHAADLADVHFEDQQKIPGVEQSLVLNGLGIRYKFFFKIYIAALYLSETDSDAGSVLASDAPRRMVMHFLYDEVSGDKLVDGWNEGFENNLSDEQLQALQPRIEQFNSLFETVSEGDVILLDYIPGQGTVVSIRGQRKGVIDGHDFNRALLSIWLGEEPVGEELKQKLLGVGQ